MRSTRSAGTRFLAAHLLAVLAVLGGGIAGAHSLRAPSGDPQQLVAQAATRVATAGSYRTTYTFGIKGQGMSVTSHGSGLSDTIRKLQSGTFEIPGGGTLEFRLVGGQTYLRLPNGNVDAAGHHWLGVPSGSDQAFQGQDPVVFLRTLTDSSGVKDLGKATVHGVATRHYTMKLDATKVLAAMSQNGSTTLPAGSVDQVKDIRTDLWLDSGNLPRRMTMAVKAAGVEVTFRFEFTDFGGRIDVAAPPASDVTRVADSAGIRAALQGALQG